MKKTNMTIKTLVGMSLALAPLTLALDETPDAPVAAEAAAVATPTPEQIKEVFSYLMGYQFGQQLAQDASSVLREDIDEALFFKAFVDGLQNQVDEEMEKKDLALYMGAYQEVLKARDAAKGDINTKAGKDFLEANAKKDGVTTTASGLQYKVLSAAEGRTFDEAKDGKSAIAVVSYEGRLLDGRVFDKSAETIEFPIDGVVPGFSEALKLMPIGSEWEVYIPSELAYGANGPGILGNNATLIFKMKLHDLKPAQGTTGNPIQLTPEMMEQMRAQGMQPVGQ